MLQRRGGTRALQAAATHQNAWPGWPLQWAFGAGFVPLPELGGGRGQAITSTVWCCSRMERGHPIHSGNSPWQWVGMLQSAWLTRTRDAAKHAAKLNRLQVTGLRLPLPCELYSSWGSQNLLCASSHGAAGWQGHGPAPISLPAPLRARGTPRGPQPCGVHGCTA